MFTIQLAQEEGLPQKANLVFKADFLSSTTPQIGTGGTFSRASTETYAATQADQFGLVTASSGSPCVPAYPFRDLGGPGIQIAPRAQNLLLQSNAPATSPWAVTGEGGTFATNNVVTGPFGTTTGNRMTFGAASESIYQETATPAGGKTFSATMYMKREGGLAATSVVLECEDESFESTITTETDWFREKFNATFAGGSAGNVQVRFHPTLGSGSVLISCIQVEDVTDATFGNGTNYGSPYIDTTVATASTQADALTYPSTNLTNAMTKGTISTWLYIPYSSTQVLTRKRILSMEDATPRLCLSIGTQASGGVIGHYNGSSFSSNTATVNGAWSNIIFTWDNTNAPGAGTFEMDINNVNRVSTTATQATPTASTLHIGRNANATTDPAQHLNGILGRTRIWSVPLTSGDRSTVYLTEKGNYGL